MTDMRAVQDSYDDLAADYERIFPDWRESSRRQGLALHALVAGELGPGPRRVLDCAAGIGTQALALAELGHRVVATDLSGAALRRMAADRRASGVGRAVADMRHLPLRDAWAEVVVCADNSLPHLLTPDDVVTALREMRRVAVPGAVLLLSTRDYDELRLTRPQVTPVQVSRAGGRTTATFQLWSWHDDGERYDYEHLMVSGAEAGWRVDRRTGTYWAISTAELSALAADAGLAGVRWLAPAESGFFQPLMVARA